MGGGQGPSARSEVQVMSILAFFGLVLWGEAVVSADSTEQDTQKVKVVKLSQTGSERGRAGPRPVISLSHFLDEVSNQ